MKVSSFGQNVVAFFDVREDARRFLGDVFESGTAPRRETQWLLDQSLLAGAEDWHALVDCARSIRRSRDRDPYGLDGTDVLTYVWHVLDGLDGDGAPPPEPWAETDRLIALARQLERDAALLSREEAHHGASEPCLPRSKKIRPSAGATSHYWAEGGPTRAHDGQTGRALATCPIAYARCNPGNAPRLHSGSVRLSNGQHQRPAGQGAEQPGDGTFLDGKPCSHPVTKSRAARPQKAAVSPYFSEEPCGKVRHGPKRRPASTVSCVPFPPLSCPSFGLIQEEVAHEPFWLLIAVTFLIKTSGQLAIPAFRRVKERFPTPGQLADPANAQELSGMIRHLGLAAVRASYIRRYARAFLEEPPRAGIRYRVGNYDKRDVDVGPWESSPDMDGDGWEIGHMTKGKYAIDSWRIFCRDELLGRAAAWDGEGREGEFQPEWMRVTPQDKELRAYLRWMWMREGWDWDPATGERRVLREELRRAVDEGRVEYDEGGAADSRDTSGCG